ncbi:GIY-YIG nuclease family protein [Maricaulis sp. CAU 1757]
MPDRETLIAVYMMSSGYDGPIYTGVTAQLEWRVQQHKRGEASGFTRKYKCTRLVWYEPHDLIVPAIRREKRIKKWPRRWKVNLIEAANPHWEDLWDSLWAVAKVDGIDLEPWRTRS